MSQTVRLPWVYQQWLDERQRREPPDRERFRTLTQSKYDSELQFEMRRAKSAPDGPFCDKLVAADVFFHDDDAGRPIDVRYFSEEHAKLHCVCPSCNKYQRFLLNRSQGWYYCKGCGSVHTLQSMTVLRGLRIEKRLWFEIAAIWLDNNLWSPPKIAAWPNEQIGYRGEQRRYEVSTPTVRRAIECAKNFFNTGSLCTNRKTSEKMQRKWRIGGGQSGSKKKRHIEFVCNACGAAALANPAVKLICGRCCRPMVAALD